MSYLFQTLATCAPFLDGYGFRAELRVVHLPSGRDVYQLVSWDAPAGHKFTEPPADLTGPTVRAECDVEDYRQGTPIKSDAHLACSLCHFWSAYAQRPEEFDRDPESPEQVSCAWWSRWDGTGGGLTGETDAGDPDTWTCDDYSPAPDDGS